MVGESEGMERLDGLTGTDRTKRTYGIERIDSIEGVERIEAREEEGGGEVLSVSEFDRAARLFEG